MKEQKNIISINASIIGLIKRYVINIICFNLGVVGTFKALNWIDDIYSKNGVSSFSEFWDIPIRGRTVNDEFILFIIYAISAFCILIVIYNFIQLVRNFYKAQTMNTIDKDKEVITEITYDLPASKNIKMIRFHRIIAVEVQQGTFDRIFHTGTLVLKTLVYTNADSITNTWYINWIIDPSMVKERILEGLPDYEGLTIKHSKPDFY